MGKLRQIAAELHTFYSTYVMYFLMGLLTFWLQMSPAEQQAVLDYFPALKLVAPFLGLVSFMIARGWPQPNNKSELA